MRAAYVRTEGKGEQIEVRRDGGTRARTEGHFWGMLAMELNESYAGEFSHCWGRMKPGTTLYNVYTLRRMRRNASDQVVMYSNYEERDLRNLYNSGETFLLDIIDV